MSIADIVERKERPAYVRFETRAIEDKAASVAAGRYIARDVDYVLITPPYSKDVMIFKVTQWFDNMTRDVQNNRLPEEWAANYRKQYELWKAGQEIPLDGTPIKGWGLASPAQQETLIRMNVRTVEDLARMNDEGIRRFGMGGVEMKNKAVAWLAQSDQGKSAAKMAELETENSRLKTDLKELRDTVEKLSMQLTSHERSVVPPVVAVPNNDAISVADLMPDDDLVGRYTAKFGKPPHHRMKPETIRKELEG